MQSIRILGSHVAKLVYAIDTNVDRAKRVAEDFGCGFAASLEEVLQDPEKRSKVDAVIVASTTDTHFSLCKMTLEARKSCFTEKPISHNPDEVAEIIGLAKEVKLPFVVGYQRRVDKNFRELKRLVTSKAIGDRIRMIRCTSRDNPLPPLEYLRTSGGIFHDMLSHDFDMIHFLTEGEIPTEIFTVAHCYEPAIKEMDDCDTVIITLKFSSGLLATVDTSRVAAYGYDQRVEVFGAEGMLTCYNESKNTVELATSSGYLKPCSSWSFPQRYEQTYTVELAEFCGMLQPAVPLVEEDAVIERHAALEKVATGAELSWRLGRMVKFSEVDSLRGQLKQHHN